MTAMNFLDYMPDGGGYTDPTTIHGFGWCIEYISSTFLDGWINYVKPIRAFALARYTEPEKMPDLLARIAAFNVADGAHTKIHTEIGDDVLMLCADAGGSYWFFWFDCDVSDCLIGRFQTDDDRATVVANFEAYCRERAACEPPGAPLDLNVASFRGWISW